jgi:hypothetical protein
MKFVLKEDWKHETDFLGKTITKIIYPKGHIFETNDNGKFEITSPDGNIIELTGKELSRFDFIEEVLETQPQYEIIIEEISDDDENLVRNWRIQLDVKTTRKKLKEVQRIIEEYVKPILN